MGPSIISRTEWNPAKPGINKGKVVNSSLPEPGSRLLVVYLERLMPDVLEGFLLLLGSSQSRNDFIFF